MNNLLFITVMTCSLISCNTKKGNEAKESKTETIANPKNEFVPNPNLSYSVDGKEIKQSASLIVTRNEDKVLSGQAFFCTLTTSPGSVNNESVSVNFLMDTKPGIYHIVGRGFKRGYNPNQELYGSILTSKPAITKYNVTLTECKDLGSNNRGGHKWSISGYWDSMPLKASSAMMIDKTKNHPAEIQLGKGTFINLTFDDNWVEIFEESINKKNRKK